ncbi:MAG: RIP metalloprotease RseP [Pseudohongiellaceae bacterium]
MELFGNIFFNLLAMLVTLGILVTIHEYGHFRIARLCGVKVEKFSIGFGKAIVRWRGKPSIPNSAINDGTEFVIAILPLGGFVKMLGEQDDVSPSLRNQAFNHKPLLQRSAIVAAGPLANFLLAIVLYWLMFITGVTGLAPVVGAVEPGSPASIAGLRAGDEILAVDGMNTNTWQVVRLHLLDRLGETGTLELEVSGPDATQTRIVSVPLNRWLVGTADPDLMDELGITPFHLVLPAKIGEVIAGGRADAAGIHVDDLISEANGVPIYKWEDWLAVIRTHPEQLIQTSIVRNNQLIVVSLQPAVRLAEDGTPELDDSGATQGYIGAAVKRPVLPTTMNRNITYSPLAAIPQALEESWKNSAFVLLSMKKMLLGLISIENISGPFTIAQVAGQTASYGLEYYLSFLAILSISLGVLNLLPIPILDGGHLFYYAVEAIIRRPVPRKIQDWGMQLGVTLVAGIMFLAIYNDINRLL